MAISSMTSPVFTAGILSTATQQRTNRAIAGTRRESAPWPWPLPMGSVLAVLDNPEAASNAIGGLRDAGVARADIWVLAGEDGARQIRDAFQERGLFARLRSLIGNEDEAVAQLEAWTDRGATVILARPSRGGLDEAGAVLTRHEPRLLRRTGRWLSTWDARPVQAAADARHAPTPGTVVGGC